MRWASADLISGERLQALAEITVITRSILEFHRSLPQSGVRGAAVFPGSHTELEPDPAAIAYLRDCRSIFVYSHLLQSFIDRILPKLDHRFVLISHNSDNGVDARFLPALGDTRIIHWFAQNAVVQHAKLTPLPIGIANAQWPHGQAADAVDAATRRPLQQHRQVYCNFDVRTNPRVRIPLLERLASSALAVHASPKPFREYLAEMAQYRWCISPPGNGVDCHRTWEALYVGTTPIVQRTVSGAALHDELPVIQLDELGHLDKALLEEWERRFESRKFDLRSLTMGYWRSRLAETLATG